VAPAAAPAVTVPHPASVPPTRIGTESSVRVTFAAEGTAELIDTAVLEGSAFTLAEDTCSGREVSGVCTIEVRFAPLTTGQHTATLRLNGERGEAVVTFTGVAYERGVQLAASPELLVFRTLSLGLLSPPQRVTVTATGDLPTPIVGTAFEGSGSSDFLVTADACTRAALVPGASCEIDVRASTSAFGDRIARLRILTDPPGPSLTVGLAASTREPGRPAPPAARLPPWHFGIIRVDHFASRTSVRLYSSFPTRATIRLIRRRSSVRSRSSLITGFGKVVVRRRLRRGAYRVRAVAQRRGMRRSDSIRFRVRR